LTASATALATAGGVGAIAILGLDGIIWAVLAGPIAGVAVASIFVARLGLPRAPRPAFSVLIAHQRAIFGVGLGLMLSALAALVTPLVLRIWLIQSQGLDAAGLFQAALAISMQVSGLILAAAATEYYPRLSATISDKNAVRHQANDQAMLYLSAGGPLIVALAALAPWVLELLYTSAFRDAVEVLRWLLLGMVARLLVVPAEMILMASASARRILAAQLLHQISVLAAAFWALDPFGGVGFAVAIAAGQVVHLILVSLMAARAAGFAWRRRVLGFAAAFAVLAACSQALPGLAGDWATIGTCCLVAGGAGLAAAGLARLGFVPRPTMLVQRRIRFARSQR
ncbi:MAG: oligosaccharide flippase family protein, partial [Pseudomonadota bacterium]